MPDHETSYALDNEEIKLPKIKVIGFGGAGCNTINNLIEQNIPGIECIAANTDLQALHRCRAERKIQLGIQLTNGLGAGGKPEIGAAAAEESFRDIMDALEGADIVFLTAGMGGGTGTGSISIAARIAKSMDIITLAIVTTPFSFEFGQRQYNANEGIAKLRPYTDTLIILPNDKLLKIAPKELPMKNAFAIVDSVLQHSLLGLSNVCYRPGLLNIDYAHVQRCLSNGGGANVTLGYGEGEEKALKAIENALHHPLLDDIPIERANSMIVNFRGGNSLTFNEIAEAMQALQDKTLQQTEIIMGMGNDESLGDKVEVLLVISGIGSEFIDTPVSIVLESTKEMPSIGNFTSNAKEKEPMQFSANDEQQSQEYLEIPSFLRKRQIPVELSLDQDG